MMMPNFDLNPSFFRSHTGGAINVLATDRNGDYCGIGGRNSLTLLNPVLKIYSIDSISEDNSQTEDLLSPFVENGTTELITDISWNKQDLNIFASLDNSGNVYFWDVSRTDKRIQCLEPKKTSNDGAVKHITFDPHSRHILLIAQQNGFVKFVDRRQNKSCKSFIDKLAISDVRFARNGQNRLATALIDGTIRVWDHRNLKEPSSHFQAHYRKINSIDWHPEHNILVSAGWGQNYVYVLILLYFWCGTPTPSACSGDIIKVRWRPGHKNQFISLSGTHNHSMIIWDVSNPNCPFAVLSPDKEYAPMDITWRGNNGNAFLFGGLNNLLGHCVFDEPRRISVPKMRPNCVDYGLGQITLLSYKSQVATADWHKPKVESDLVRVNSLSPNWFVESALRFKFHGDDAVSLCQYNADVAQKLKRTEIEISWLILKRLITMTKNDSRGFELGGGMEVRGVIVRSVVETIDNYVEGGDVQMGAVMTMVGREWIGEDMGEDKAVKYILGYLDLLERFELWVVSAEVVKYSGYERVGRMSHHHTSIMGRCSGENDCEVWKEGTVICDNCGDSHVICSLCNHPVRGLFLWCQECNHGGHVEHLNQWFEDNQQCPSGCGHCCQH